MGTEFRIPVSRQPLQDLCLVPAVNLPPHTLVVPVPSYAHLLYEDWIEVEPCDPHHRRRLHTNYYAVWSTAGRREVNRFTHGNFEYWFHGRWLCRPTDRVGNGYGFNRYRWQPVRSRQLRKLRARYSLVDESHVWKGAPRRLVFRAAAVRLDRVAPHDCQILFPYEDQWCLGYVGKYEDPRVVKRAAAKQVEKEKQQERKFLRRRTIYDVLRFDD